MAASQRLTRALQEQLGDELSKELFTWMAQMESSRSELAELHADTLKFVVQTNHRFDTLESKFNGLEARFVAFEGKFVAFEGKFVAFEGKFVAFEAKFGAFESRFERFETRFDRQDDKLDRLIALVEKRHAELMKWLFTCWCGSVFAIVALVLAAR